MSHLDTNPTISEDGVPYCSENDCQRYDGKRCEITGNRPGNICEPTVIEMARTIKNHGDYICRRCGLRVDSPNSGEAIDF